METKQQTNQVFFDADCIFCTSLVGKFRDPFEQRGFDFVPLQSAIDSNRYTLPPEEFYREMKLLRHDGIWCGGVAAYIEMFKAVPLLRPVAFLLRLPVFNWIADRGYRWIAANRTCLNGSCQIKRKRLTGYLPLLLLTATAFSLINSLAPWVFMWTMCFALFFGCKWMTLRQLPLELTLRSIKRTLGFLFVWPGMNAQKFLDDRKIIDRPAVNEWMFASVKTGFGILLTWRIARTIFPVAPLPAGWVGMIGLIFFLHFGGFHLLSLAWRNKGVSANPLMLNPIRAHSLTDFWGKRWNTGFHELAHRFVFNRIFRETGLPAATLITFLVSGLIHDLIISLPAGDGFGLPTAYFLIQGFGVVAERSAVGKKLGLGNGALGWLFVFIVTAAPVFWLFHPPFVNNVILPMLHAIGAI